MGRWLGRAMNAGQVKVERVNAGEED